MSERTLLDQYDENGSCRLEASLSDGCLHLSGCDTGSLVEEIWGDSDYEYWYDFDAENTKKLYDLLHGILGEDDLLSMLYDCYNDTDKKVFISLMDFCNSHEIKYRFFSYV